MDKERPIFVIDTNVVVDYEDIIPSLGGPVAVLEEPTVDLSRAHLVIPSVVIRELSSFKGEKSERGKVARTVLRRLREVFESKLKTMHDMYHLEASVKIGKQMISVLPVNKNFAKGIPFRPADSDMDGQIILTAMTVEYLLNGMKIDGTETREFRINQGGKPVVNAPSDWNGDGFGKLTDMAENRVTLLTNDNGLAIRARERGIVTMRYGHKYPAPYTGRRDVVVPAELLGDFLTADELPREVFEKFMPDEPKLVENEFIVMSVDAAEGYPLGYDPENDVYFDRIGRYNTASDSIQHLHYVRQFPGKPHNPGQAIYAEALADPSIAAVICTGPAGSGKTYMATVYGYTACQAGQFIGVMVVPCESKSKIGALPGDMDEKMDPDVRPLKNALRNYLLHEDRRFRKELEVLRKYGVAEAAKHSPAMKPKSSGADEEEQEDSLQEKLRKEVDMIWRNWFVNLPIETARGQDFSYGLAIYDEFQDQTPTQADTLVKRLGKEGKIVLTGDIQQIHAVYLDQYNNGLVYASKLLFDNPMVAQVCFTEDEVVRHPLVQMIAKRQAEANRKTQ